MNWFHKPAIVKFKQSPYFYLWLFLAAYSVFCSLTFKDYGITWDEPIIYDRGSLYLHYYFQPWLVDNLSTVEDATHNYIYSGFLRLFCSQGNYTAIHLVNLLFGSFLFVAVYCVLLVCYRKRIWALTGCLFLFLTPRLMGELSFNPKDIPFAILYFITLAGIFLIPRSVKGWGTRSFLIGTLIGVTACLRILGLTLAPIYILYSSFELLNDKSESQGGWLKLLRQWLLAGLFCQFWMMMLWPYLDHDFVNGLLVVLKESRFYYWDGLIFFMGQLIHPSERLWYYLPVWISITTPIFILVFFLFSFSLFKRSKRNEAVFSLWFLLFVAFVVNAALYFLLKPIIYNGLRHYLFLVPVISIMATIGFIEFFISNWRSLLGKATMALVLLNAVLVMNQIVQLYPYDYLYFNEFAGGLKGAYGKYETDYMGASLKEASQWLRNHEPDRPIKVWVSASIEQSDYYFGPNMTAQREQDGCDYWIALNKEGDLKMTTELQKKIIYTVQREDVPLTYVLKMK